MKKEKIQMDINKIKVATNSYGQVYGDTVGTPLGRIVWPYLSAPRPGKKNEQTGQQNPPKYETSLLIPKDGKHTAAFLKLLTDYVKHMAIAFNKGKSVKISIEGALRDGDDTQYYKPDKASYYAGNWILVARHSDQPVICNTVHKEDGWEEIPAKDVQGGMLCRLIVAPMITAGGQLTYQLFYVQFVTDDGSRLGGGFDRKSYSGLLSGDDFDDSDGEVTAEDAADDALGEEEVDEDTADDSEEEAAEPDDDEEPFEAPKKRGRPAGVVRKTQPAAQPLTRRGKGALIDRL